MTRPAATDATVTRKGRFIVLEGIDGAGKSTHLDFVCATLERHCGRAVVRTREPGGTPLGESIRSLLLGESAGGTDIDGETETLLAFAARRAHVEGLIGPMLREGRWVVSDRYTDSTRAYQGGGAGVDSDWIESLAEKIETDCIPDRVYVFDLPADQAAHRRSGRNPSMDRFEARGCDYFERVRTVYLRQAERHPGRYRIIDARLTVEQIHMELEKDILTL